MLTKVEFIIYYHIISFLLLAVASNRDLDLAKRGSSLLTKKSTIKSLGGSQVGFINDDVLDDEHEVRKFSKNLFTVCLKSRAPIFCFDSCIKTIQHQFNLILCLYS